MTDQEQITSCSDEGDSTPASPWRRVAYRIPALFGIVLLVAAVYVIQKEIKSLSLSEVRYALHAIPACALLAGVICTILSYFILSFYDRLACYHIGTKQSFRRTAFAAFCSYVLSHNLGFTAISGAAVRYRLYRNWGASPGEVAQIIAFCSTTYLFGAMALIGGVLLIEPGRLPLVDQLPHFILRCGGAMAWLGIAVYLVVSLRYRQMRVWRYSFDIPRFPVALAQVIVSAADMAMTAMIAFVLLPSEAAIGFPAFLAIYIASYTAGLVASVPGGLGVFDGAMLFALRPHMPTPQILGVILTFRLFYYIIPLFMAGAMFAAHELFLRGDAAWARRHGEAGSVALMRRPSQVVRESEADFSVTVATGVVAGVGILLVFYVVAVPAPLIGSPFAHLMLQAAEFMLCLTGVMLVGVAAGLAQRVTAAWRAALTLLGVAIPLVIVCQGPLEIPLCLMLIMFLIAPFRACYYRKARLFSEPLAPTLVAPTTLWIASLASVGLFSLRHHLGHAWWRSLIYDAHTSAVRWALGISAIMGIVAIIQMLRRSHVLVRPWVADTEALYKGLAHALQELGPRPLSGLLLNDNGRAGIPFFRTKQFIVGVGDPAGAGADCVTAIWRLRDLAIEEGRRAVFIRVEEALLDVYHDIGMTICPGVPGESGATCCYAQDLQAVKSVLGNQRERHNRRFKTERFLSVKARGTSDE